MKRKITIGALVFGLTASVVGVSVAITSYNPMVETNTNATQTINEVNVTLPTDCKKIINAGITQGYGSYDREYIVGENANGDIKMYLHELNSDEWTVRNYNLNNSPKLEVDNGGK